jgi:hypothetical protein
MIKVTRKFLLHSIKLKCNKANPMQTELLINSIKRYRKDDLAYVLKKIQVLPNGDIRLCKTKPSKAIDSLFYDWGICCTNCGEEVVFKVPRGITGLEYSRNLVCIACGCKYDADCDFDEDGEI